ncbi:MAG: hypothetical protein Tsb009_11990 [Planctomycetaceae bacterium]
MARQESDREDLLAEATALIRRAEFAASHEPEPVTAGIKRSGYFSIYFGGDPVYHFNDRHQLRRAFVKGFLFRTQGTTLSRMRRNRTEEATVLQRTDLNAVELEAFLQEMRQRLAKFVACIEAGEVTVMRAVPAGDDFLAETLGFLKRVIDSPDPLAPPIAGKR